MVIFHSFLYVYQRVAENGPDLQTSYHLLLGLPWYRFLWFFSTFSNRVTVVMGFTYIAKYATTLYIQYIYILY